MRIRLNENEVYEIKLPDEANLTQFIALTNKFSNLLKNFNKFDVPVVTTNNSDIVIQPEHQEVTFKNARADNKKQWIFLRDNRDAFVQILKIYYHGTPTQWEDIINKHGIEMWRDKKELSNAGTQRLKEMHKIQAGEVGLTKFPTRGESRTDFRVKGFKI